MSIYASWLWLSDQEHASECGRYEQTMDDNPKVWDLATDDGRYFRYHGDRACTCDQKGPLVYHGSHVNPDAQGERGGCVEVGVIPNHCHPSTRASGGDGEAVWFLRLCVTEDPCTYHGMQPGDATVVLDRRHVTELRDTLTQWLESEERW